MNTLINKKLYDVVIVGGGASGTALLYTLSKYTNIQNIALFEKYKALGTVNSNAKNNSQTLHVGDIETNYNLEKIKEVKPASMMVKYYTDTLSGEEKEKIIKKVQKMVLAVGDEEVKELETRYAEIKNLFPKLQKLNSSQINEVEPNIIKGRNSNENVLALFNPEGYAVNFEKLSQSFALEAQKQNDKNVEVMLGYEIKKIYKKDGLYVLQTNKGVFEARIVIVDADAYSLGFAKSLGYGEEFSLIPISGNFYFTPECLNGKVYRVQDKKMPFAAVHGDPDLTVAGLTRWGPTAQFFPILESRKFNTFFHFLKCSGLHKINTWLSLFIIILEPARFLYFIKNMFYNIPLFGRYLFLTEIRKIVPSLKVKDVIKAKEYGGMRLQRVDIKSHKLLLGEGKIVGENIIFNMTPSPGASVCLYNAMIDTEQIIKFDNNFFFNKERMLTDLYK